MLQRGVVGVILSALETVAKQLIAVRGADIFPRGSGGGLRVAVRDFVCEVVLLLQKEILHGGRHVVIAVVCSIARSVASRVRILVAVNVGRRSFKQRLLMLRRRVLLVVVLL